jgi:hypothetical protein
MKKQGKLKGVFKRSINYAIIKIKNTRKANLIQILQYLVKQYIQLKTKFKDRASYISFWLRATYIKSALAVFTPSNIF